MASYIIKSTVLGALNQGLIVAVDILSGDIACADTPVVGIVLPNDGAETKRVSNGANTVVDVTKRRLRENEQRNEWSAAEDVPASMWGCSQ